MAEIVVLGWGSLIWDPRNLILRDGKWHDDGPSLPVEFSRVSRDRRLTLALTRGAELVRTFWSYMGTDSVGEAVWSLAHREGAKPEEVGYLDLECGDHWCRTVDEHLGTMKGWVEEQSDNGNEIDVVIWTDLKPNFEKKVRKKLNGENAVEYLKGLRPEMKDRAREYIEKAPEQVQTRIRAAITDGWDSIW